MALTASIMHLVVGETKRDAGHTTRRADMTISAIRVQGNPPGVIGAMVCYRLVIAMTDHTGGIGASIRAIDNSGPNRTPERQPLRVGLGCLIIVVA